MGRAVWTQTYLLNELGRKLDAVSGDVDDVSGLKRRVSSNMEKLPHGLEEI